MTVPTDNFVRTLIDTGTSPAVANELERRIEVIETEEAHDKSRLPFSPFELIVYIGTAVAACVIGLLVVVL